MEKKPMLFQEGELQTSSLTSLIQEGTQDKMQVFNLIKDINMVVAYDHSDEELAKWTETIFRLYPNVTPEVIGKIVDNFLKGVEMFDSSIGIVNFTSKINSYMGVFKHD